MKHGTNTEGTVRYLCTLTFDWHRNRGLYVSRRTLPARCVLLDCRHTYNRRTGSVIAEEFKKAGLDFVVIEHDPEVANELRKKNLTVVEGDATREETLKKAGVERASGLVATLPSDSDNLFLCFTAKELNKNIEIVTRASSEEAAKRLHSIGAKKAIIVEEIGGKMLARCLISDTP
jgi:voltage-gated potassium channel